MLVGVVFALSSPTLLVCPTICSSDTVLVLFSGFSSDSETSLEDLETHRIIYLLKSHLSGYGDDSHSRIHGAS